MSVESAVVKYTDKTKAGLTRMVLDGEIISRYTNPDGCLQLGMIDVPDYESNIRNPRIESRDGRQFVFCGKVLL